jgi:sulfane dehydrogenase subunit SoxC
VEREAKSVSTSPSGSMQPLAKDGHDEITGLAWSGRGTVKRVDISTDGGWNWARAQLQSPMINLAR